jgi:hypothetical protein
MDRLPSGRAAIAADGRTHLFAPNGFFVATEELTEGN